MFKKINSLKYLIVFFVAFFTLAISAYACNDGGNNNYHGKKKTTMCHVQQGKHGRSYEITVSHKDVFEHLTHGDYIGKCGNNNHNNKKILICHIPFGNPNNSHEIFVDMKALKAHLAHGDYVGKCETETPVCGDSELDSGEQCDDGNTSNNDGCSATCKLEVCGDGAKQTNEQCDDGNIANNDGCSAICNLEVCGDNVKQSNEQCDDGNLLNNDGCSLICKLEVCGDNIQQTNEQCDDGNLVNGDGCDSMCAIEVPVNEIFARGILTAITKNGAQTGEANLNFSTNTFANLLLNCTDWNACSLKIVRSAEILPYDFSATFDTGTLSPESCDGNGVCTANSAFVMPTDSTDLSMTLSFTNTTGLSVGEATIALDPSNDKINVTGTVGVIADSGENMLTIGEAEASDESDSKVTNIAIANDGALAASSTSLMASYDHSSGVTSNQSIASGTGAVSASNDSVGANVNSTVNHNVSSNGTGENAISSCTITSQSQGDSIATLDALAQDGINTADSVNHTEILNALGANVTVTADCGDVQF